MATTGHDQTMSGDARTHDPVRLREPWGFARLRLSQRDGTIDLVGPEHLSHEGREHQFVSDVLVGSP
jgi:hypothetical protein